MTKVWSNSVRLNDKGVVKKVCVYIVCALRTKISHIVWILMTKISHIKVCVLMTKVQSYCLCFNEKGGRIVCVLLTKV